MVIMSYANAGVAAPANASDNSYTFFKPTFDHVFAVYNAYVTSNDAALATTNTNVATNTTAIGTPDANSVALRIAKRDANAAIALGSINLAGASTITNGIATILATATPGQTLDLFALRQQTTGYNAFRVDVNGNVVVGDALGTARALTVVGAIVATTTITANTGTGFIGPLTGDVAGNATGVKGVAAGSMLVGTGAGAMAAIAGGTSGYILTSNGPSISPTWQANAGGAGAGTATLANIKNVSTDANLGDMLTRWASGPVIDSVQAWTSGNVTGLAMIISDPTNPLGVIINGNIRKSTVSVYSGVGNLTSGVQPAGWYTLVAETSTAGTNLFTLSIIAPGGTILANQLVIGQCLWDGNNFQVLASGGFVYTIQPVVDGLNTRDRGMQMPVFNPNGGTALSIGSGAALPGATNGSAQIIVTQHLPISGLRAVIDYGCEMLMGATPALLQLYPVYSTSTNGGAPNQFIPVPSGMLSRAAFLGAASGQSSVGGQAIVSNITDKWFNLGFVYTTASATNIINYLWANVRFTRG